MCTQALWSFSSYSVTGLLSRTQTSVGLSPLWSILAAFSGEDRQACLGPNPSSPFTSWVTLGK